MSSERRHPLHIRQRGAALLLFALIFLIVGLGMFFGKSPAPAHIERDDITAKALAQAKAALIGYAVTYHDRKPNENYGYLPCPDKENKGVAEPSCGTTDESVIGRLPWKTLGLPPLRDGNGECLWYVVSGQAKNEPKTPAYNWDTVGLLQLKDFAGNFIAGTTPHEQPLAIVFSVGALLTGKSRTSAGDSECGGSNAIDDYLDQIFVGGVQKTGLTPGAISSNLVEFRTANAESIGNGTNNDRALPIVSREIFDLIKLRTDFKLSIEALLDEITTPCLNNIPLNTLPPSSANKGIDNLATYITSTSPVNCIPYNDPNTFKRKFFDNWKNNVLYATMSSTDISDPLKTITVGDKTECKGILVFGGQRTAAQTRNDTADSNNYLEALLSILPKPQDTPIPDGRIFPVTRHFDASVPTNDIAICVKGLPPGATQKSFATDFGNFAVAGDSGAVNAKADDATLTLQDASGTNGGCFWFGDAIPLAGKTLRAFYDFKFTNSDSFTQTGSSDTFDNGYGFTLQLVEGGMGVPSRCGSTANMGALTGTVGDVWGNPSIVVETDVRNTSSKNDPSANHTAIMLNGNLYHSAGTMGSLCDGSQSGCRFSPENKFEEFPTPLSHNQRIEIVTGCNPSCSSCIPAKHNEEPATSYAKITAWVDCTDCRDVSSNLDQTSHPPTIRRCTNAPLVSPMNTIYIGLTGGFFVGDISTPETAALTRQGVTIENFVVRSE